MKKRKLVAVAVSVAVSTAALVVLLGVGALTHTALASEPTRFPEMAGPPAPSAPAANEFDVIINEWSQGHDGSKEWVELLVVNGPIDMRGWDLGDDSPGDLTFSNDPLWSNVSAGSLIVIYNGSDKDTSLPADDTDISDYVVVVPHTDTTYFSGSWPALNNTNNSDNPHLRDDGDITIHNYSTDPGSTAALHPGRNQCTYYQGNSASGVSTASNWGNDQPADNATPGEGNGGDNTTWIDGLRTGGVKTFLIAKSAPAVVSPNQLFTYTLVITNSTGISTTGTVISDVIPTNSTFFTASNGGVQMGNVVSWTVSGLFADGSTISRTFQVTASSASGVNIVNDDYGVRATNWTTFTAGSPVTTTVSSLDLTISKTAPASVNLGDLFTYIVTVQNETGLDLTNLVITDAAPANTALAYALDGGTVMAGDVVSWTTGILSDDLSLSVRFVVTATGNTGNEVWNDAYAVWAANWPTPTVGSPLLTVIGDYIPIYQIQGDGFESPYNGQMIKTVGVVVGFFEGNVPSGGANFDGFFIQDPAGDGITTTSDAIFVNHGTASVSVNVGDPVTVTGQVQEFNEYGDPCPTCETQIAIGGASDIEKGPNVALPVATVLDPPGDPTASAAYFESLEGMRVTLPMTGAVVGPTSYGTVMVVPGDEGVSRVMRHSPQEGMPFGVRFYNRYGSGVPNLIVGSVVTNVDGPLAYTYGNYVVTTQAGDDWQVVHSQTLPITAPTWPEAAVNQFTVATFNTYNFDEASGTKMTKVVSTIVQMNGPTFLGLQEIAVETAITDLLNNLSAHGYDYDYAYSHPDVGGHGVALLWRTDRVSNVDWSTDYQACSTYGSESAEAYDDRCPADDEYPLFSRRPVVLTGTVEYGGVETQVVVIANHFKSKRGGAEADQRRLEQARFVAGLVTSVPNVLVLGDLNDFEDSPSLEELYAIGNLTNTWCTLPAEARYNYIYRGVSQVLDHVLVSPALLAWLEGASPLHNNADFPYNPYTGDDTVIWRTSDHDPVAATFILPHQVYLPLVMRQH